MLFEILREVFPYVVAFWLMDGVLHVPPGQALFLAHWGARFCARGAGLHAAGLLPTDRALAGDDPHLWVTSSGVYALRAGLRDVPQDLEMADVELRPFDRLGKLTTEANKVLVDGRRFLALGSPAAATRLAAALRAVRDAEPGERLRIWAEYLGREADPAPFEELERRVRGRMASLQASGLVVFAGTFVLMPAILYVPSIPSGLLQPLVLVLAVAYAVAIVVGHRALREAGTPSPGMVLLPVYCLPLVASRAALVVSRGLGSRASVALAVSLLPRPALVAWARREAHRLRHRRRRVEGELHEAMQAQEQVVLATLARAGVTPADMASPPETLDPAASSYCPVCTAQFRSGVSACPECRVDVLPATAAPA